jgi:hypothetical protein
VRSSAAVLAAVGMTGCALSGCSFGGGESNVPIVRREALQQDIAKRLGEAGEKPRSVRCDSDLIGELRARVHCDVVVSETNSFEPIITVVGVDGAAVDYEMTPAVSAEQLEAVVARLVSESGASSVSAVSCQSGIEGRVGAVTRCDVEADGSRGMRTLSVTEVRGLTMKIDLVAPHSGRLVQ